MGLNHYAKLYQDPRLQGYIRAFQGFLPHLKANASLGLKSLVLRPTGTFQVVKSGKDTFSAIQESPENLVIALFSGSAPLSTYTAISEDEARRSFNSALNYRRYLLDSKVT